MDKLKERLKEINSKLFLETNKLMYAQMSSDFTEVANIKRTIKELKDNRVACVREIKELERKN